jgi:hypothetical protein
VSSNDDEKKTAATSKWRCSATPCNDAHVSIVLRPDTYTLRIHNVCMSMHVFKGYTEKCYLTLSYRGHVPHTSLAHHPSPTGMAGEYVYDAWSAKVTAAAAAAAAGSAQQQIARLVRQPPGPGPATGLAGTADHAFLCVFLKELHPFTPFAKRSSIQEGMLQVIMMMMIDNDNLKKRRLARVWCGHGAKHCVRI